MKASVEIQTQDTAVVVIEDRDGNGDQLHLSWVRDHKGKRRMKVALLDSGGALLIKGEWKNV